MWDFSNDEWFFFFLATAVVVVGSVQYYRPLVIAPPHNLPMRLVLWVLPLAAALPTYVVLRCWADPQVVGHIDHTALFLLGAGAWILFTAHWLPILGISLRDDALERNNLAALIAACGTVLGVGLVYALSNIGAGPTIWTTIGPAAIGTVWLGLLTLLMEWIGQTEAEAVTIDRDVASGLRLAGATLGCATVLGRAAAGNWVSWDQTWGDFFVHGWPVLLLAMVAAAIHRWLQPTAANPRPNSVSRGIVPAALFILIGILCAVFL